MKSASQPIYELTFRYQFDDLARSYLSWCSGGLVTDTLSIDSR